MCISKRQREAQFSREKICSFQPIFLLGRLERDENSWWDKKKNSSKIGEKALILFIGSLAVSGHHVENWAPKFCLSPKMPRRWKSICFDSLFGDGAWRQRRFLGCNNSELSISIFFLRSTRASRWSRRLDVNQLFGQCLTTFEPFSISVGE